MTTKAIQTLQENFPAPQVILPQTEEFNTLNTSYLSALESDITPACIFCPRSAEDVSKFLKIIAPLATCGEAEFAIKGAGQQPLPGCANVEAGITLDLSLLTGVDVKDTSVSIAAGERWGDVYKALEGKNCGVCGSRSSRGGIGGLALAGGLSFFSSREGFISDNVLAYEIVLAPGKIVNASATENPDLWRALRGGGNNFGIVTRYEVRTFEQGPFWCGSVYYFQPSFTQQIDALVAELTAPDATDETHLMISVGYASQFGQVMCQNQVYYTRETETLPTALQPFTDIQPKLDQISSLRIQGLKAAAGEQAAVAMDQQRCAYMNTTVKADAAILKAAADMYTAALEPIKGLEGVVCSLTLQPYATSLLKKSSSQGGNSLGLTSDDGPLVSVLLLTYWKNKSDDAQIIGLMKGTLERIDQEAQQRNLAVPFKYLNYAFNFQDPIASYGAENKAKLQEVARKYDPEGVFQKHVPGGFKLFP
ncbi:FAD-binding domain-containing protein [Aspergillus californicus]